MTEDNAQQNLFTRPGFIAATVVVALLAVAGLTIGIVNATRDDPEPTLRSSASPTSEPTETTTDASICGLDGTTPEGRLTSAPDAEWAYQGTIAYPTSAEYGPGKTSPEGVRYCFQHSPEGALFAATNAVAAGGDPAVAPSWIEYFLSADTPGREQLVADIDSASSAASRLNVAGFRLLFYDESSAVVDVLVRGASGGNAVYGSAIYSLVWEDGDWKLLPHDISNPLQMAQIPDATGYVRWGE